MINSLVIKNFRSHKNTKLEFCDGVNCIIGLPDSGKTNIIRSLNWALTNRPLGFRFHSDFSKEETSVSIQFDNGEIELSKLKSKSIYSHKGRMLKAIGSDVPDVITRQSNMSELNLQEQMDKPFLICETSGEVAKIFNRISNLEKPDQAIASLTTEINSTNKEIKILNTQQLELEEKLKKFKDLPKMKHEYAILVGMNAQKTPLIQEINSISGLLADCEEASKHLKKKVDTATAFKQLAVLRDQQIQIDQEQKDLVRLNNAIKEIKLLEEKYKNIRDEFTDTQEDFAEFLKTIKVCPYCKVCKEPISKHNIDKLVKVKL